MVKIASGLQSKRCVSGIELADAVETVKVSHFVWELDLEIIRRMWKMRFQDGRVTFFNWCCDPLRWMLLSSRIKVIDETVMSMVQIDPQLHGQWAEIERGGEDRGISSDQDLWRIIGD
jgi:hypothetical protein